MLYLITNEQLIGKRTQNEANLFAACWPIALGPTGEAVVVRPQCPARMWDIISFTVTVRRIGSGEPLA